MTNTLKMHTPPFDLGYKPFLFVGLLYVFAGITGGEFAAWAAGFSAVMMGLYYLMKNIRENFKRKRKY